MARNYGYGFDRSVMVHLTGLPVEMDEDELKNALGELEGLSGFQLMLVPNNPSEALLEFHDALSADMGVASLEGWEMGGSQVAAVLASPHVKGEAWGDQKVRRGKKSPEKRKKGKGRYLARKLERKAKGEVV